MGFKGLLNMFLVTVALFGSNSCHQMSNKIDPIELNCGSTGSASSAYVHVQPVTDEGPIANPSGIQAQLTDTLGQASPITLEISAKGCALIPKDRVAHARLDMLLKDSTVAGTKVFTEKPEQDFDTIRLQPSRAGKYALSCPKEGIFASQSFINPLNITEPGSLETMRLTVIAQPMNASSPAIPLFAKDFGFSLESRNLRNEISTRDLPEGVYYLRAVAASLTEEFGLAPKFLNDETGCALTVIKKTPVMESEIFTQKGVFVARKNSALPLMRDPGIHEVTYCRQPFQSGHDKAQSCQDLAQECSKASAFRPVSEETTAATGLFHYFFYAYDRAGNPSDLQCQPIAVIDQAPQIAVAWGPAEWNQPNATMKDAALTIKPIITMADSQTLPRDQVEQSLQCRAEFISKEGNIIKGNDVTCLQGRCQGLSLEDFVPCDASFSMSLARAWKHSYIKSATLNLVVEAAVGGGSNVTVSKKISIQGSRWQVERLTIPGQDTNQVFASIRIDSRSFLASFGAKGTYIWTADAWTPLVPASLNSGEVRDSKILQDPEGTIFGFFQTKNDGANESRLQAFTFVNGGWEPLDQQPPFADCGLLIPGFAAGFACLGSQNKILAFDGSAWSPEPATPAAANAPVLRMAYLDPKTLALATRSSIHVKPAGEDAWKKIFSVPEDTSFNIMQVQALEGDLWVYTSDIATATVSRLSASPEGAWTTFPIEVPKVQVASLNTTRALALDNQNRLHYFSYQWEPGTGTWKNVPDALGFAGYDAKTTKDLAGRNWLVSKVGFQSQDLNQFWPTGLAGVEPLLPLLTLENGDLIFQGMPAAAEVVRLYRFTQKSHITLNSDTSSLLPETFPDSWTGADGKIQTISFRRGEVLTLNNSSWQTTDTFSSSTANGFKEKSLPLKNGGLALILGAGVSVKRSGQPWKQILKLGDPLKKILTEAGERDVITLDTLARLEFLGETADETIMLGLTITSTVTPIADFVAIKPDGNLKLKTVKSVAKITPASHAVTTKDGTLVTLEFTYPNGQRGTLFVLLNSDLDVITSSKRDVSDLYNARMSELGPEYIHERFLRVFPLNLTNRNAICAFRTRIKGDNQTGRFFCLELITSPVLGLGKAIAMPTHEQITSILDNDRAYDPLPSVRLVDGRQTNLLVLGHTVFEAPSLGVNSVWTTRISRQDLIRDTGIDSIIHSAFYDVHDRFILGIQSAGVLVLD